MSILAVSKGAVKIAHKLLAGTSSNDVLENASTQKTQYIVNSILIANADGSACTLTLHHYDGTTDNVLLSVYSIAAHDYLLLEFPVPMAFGDKIKGTAGTDSKLTVSVAYADLGNA